jgi:hypothetical protein
MAYMDGEEGPARCEHLGNGTFQSCPLIIIPAMVLTHVPFLCSAFPTPYIQQRAPMYGQSRTTRTQHAFCVLGYQASLCHRYFFATCNVFGLFAIRIKTWFVPVCVAYLDLHLTDLFCPPPRVADNHSQQVAVAAGQRSVCCVPQTQKVTQC